MTAPPTPPGPSIPPGSPGPAAELASAAELPSAADKALRIAAVVVGTVAAVLVALASGFLVPFRIGSASVPICLLVSIVGNVVAVRWTYRATGWKGAMLGPAMGWLVATLPLTIRTAEGDVVIPGNLTGVALLVLGSLALAGTAYVGILGPPPPSPNRDLRIAPEPVTGDSRRGTM